MHKAVRKVGSFRSGVGPPRAILANRGERTVPHNRSSFLAHPFSSIAMHKMHKAVRQLGSFRSSAGRGAYQSEYLTPFNPVWSEPLLTSKMPGSFWLAALLGSSMMTCQLVLDPVMGSIGTLRR